MPFWSSMSCKNAMVCVKRHHGVDNAALKGNGAGRTNGRLHVETHMFDVARLVETDQALRKRFDLVLWKNEPMIVRARQAPRESLCACGVRGGRRHLSGRGARARRVRIGFRGACPGFFETGGRAAGNAGREWLGRGGRRRYRSRYELDRWAGWRRDQGGRLQEGNAIDAPGGVGEFLGELGFGGSGGFVFVEEATAMRVVGGSVFGREDGAGGR